MSARALWLLSLPLALVDWIGIVYFTGAVPPSRTALLAFLPLLALAVTMTLAPWVWTIARRLWPAGTGRRPALALRASAWIGLWVSVCVGLQYSGFFNWAVALSLAAILGLLESFLLQAARQGAARR